MDFKILMFGWEFPPYNSGGLGSACLGLTKALVNQGVRIIFILPKKIDINTDYMKMIFADQRQTSELLSFRSVDVLLMPYLTSEQYEHQRTMLKTGQVADNSYSNSLLEEVDRYSANARLIASQEDFDIIHAHEWLAFGAGIMAKKVSGKPFIAHVHATEFDRAGSNINQQIYEREKQGMEQADLVVANSYLTKNTIIKHYGISPDKIQVVYNGIEVDERKNFSNQEREISDQVLKLKKAGNKMVLFLGRMTLQKGPDYFLQAAKRVLEYRENVFFVMAGTGDMQQQIIRQSAELGIADKVLFAGFVRDYEQECLYQTADLFVMPSVSEPFGIVSLEALASGAPVLISKQSGVAEILTNVLKADFWDTDEMANKIIAVLDHAPLKNCLSEFGKTEVRKISWQKAAGECVDIYQNLKIKNQN